MTVSANLPWSEQYRIVAKQWVDADSAANVYEEMKSATLANLMLRATEQTGETVISRLEMNVKGSDEWRDYIANMNEARHKATRLKVQIEYIKMKFQEWSSENANKRAEMRL